MGDEPSSLTKGSARAEPSRKENHMRDWITLLIGAVLLLVVAVNAHANTVTVSWQTDNAEPDVQYYQVYMGDSDTTLVPFGDRIFFNPNDSPATTLTVSPDIEVPAGGEVTKWFSVTAIDTSGNESSLATPVSVTIDAKPPAAPTGLTVVINIIVVE